MQKQNNLSEIRKKIAEIISKDTVGTNTITSHRFNLVSANLFRILPHLDFDQHQSVYTEIILHKQLTHYEQTRLDVLHSITVENLSNELLQLMRSTPCILSSFHFGNYRLMNLFLTKNKIPYTIVIPKASLQKEGNIFKEIHQKMCPTDTPEPIRFIEMESQTLSLKMIRELKQGRNLFIYFDGYSGVGELHENKRYGEDRQINFLGQPHLARVGVAYLAHMAGVPLITGLSYRKSLDDLRLRFFEPLFPNIKLTREQFAYDATQTLYDRFSQYLAIYPGQWEAWLYLHRSLPRGELLKYGLSSPVTNENVSHSGRFRFNHNKFGIFKIQQNAYLFNKKTYTTYAINDELYNVLMRAIYETISPDVYTSLTIRSFMENQVIIPSAA